MLQVLLLSTISWYEFVLFFIVCLVLTAVRCDNNASLFTQKMRAPVSSLAEIRRSIGTHEYH